MIDRGVDGSIREGSILGRHQGASINNSGTTDNASISNTDIVSISLGWDITSNKLLPRLVGGLDDLEGEGTVLDFTVKGKLVGRLAIGNLVVAEPVTSGLDESGTVSLDIFNVVQFLSHRVLGIDDDDLPVGLALIKECHDTQDLDWVHGARLHQVTTNLYAVQRIIIASALGVVVNFKRRLPSLREGAIVPNVPVIGEQVLDKTDLALLDVLLDGIHQLFLADLELGVGEARDLTDHVKEALGLVSVQWDIMERANNLTLLILYTAILSHI